MYILLCLFFVFIRLHQFKIYIKANIIIISILFMNRYNNNCVVYSGYKFKLPILVPIELT